jgi:TPR repeat protein
LGDVYTAVEEFLSISQLPRNSSKRKTADLDDVDAINSFGYCLEHGQGVGRDIDQTILCYRMSAKQCHPDGI